MPKQRKEPFKVAAVQFNPEIYERDKNINALLEVVTEAAENGAKLIVTPEMATTGYSYNGRESIEPFVDTIPGKTTEAFIEVAKKYDVYVVVGMPEVDEVTDIYYNSAFLVGPEGYIGKYRKVQLWHTEGDWSAWGELGVPVFETKLGKIAINICMDSVYFELARLAALKGADILAFSTNSSAQAIWLLQARAEENGFYIVSSNRSNTERGTARLGDGMVWKHHMIGASAIWSPEGEKLAESEFIANEEDDIDEPTITYAEIDPKNYDNCAKGRLEERRPELYKDLILHLPFEDYINNSKSHNITAAALQYEPVIEHKKKNMDKIEKLIEETMADNQDLDLIVLPELSATGPVKSLDKANDLAETLEGKTLKRFEELAKNNEVYILFGMIEKKEQKLYNSAALINKNGELVGKYRKTHLNSIDEIWAEPGDKIQVFSTDDLGRIGIMIGYDAAFPEVGGVMAVDRADFIAIPSSWQGEFGSKIKADQNIPENKYPEGSMSIWNSIALSTQAYVLVANFVGTEKDYLGRSALYTLDPLYGLDQPSVAAQAREESLIVNFSTIQADWWLNQEKIILSRRTHLYKPLVY